jgi:hypothetical protein
VLDLTYYTEDIDHTDEGRVYGGGGVRASIPFTRLYPDVESTWFNLNGINHKIVLTGNYYVAQSSVPYANLPQLDQLNDDASDQALRDLFTPGTVLPGINAAHGAFIRSQMVTGGLFDPQKYAIRRLVDNRADTLDDIEVFQADLRQRLQTKRGYPGQEHIMDWMTLDLSADFFPHAVRDNFGEHLGFVQYDWLWNVGDRNGFMSTGFFDPVDQGVREFTFGAFFDRPDRTSLFLGYRQIDPIESKAVTAAISYVFSPKYSVTASATYDFGTNQSLANTLILTRVGSDLTVSFGITYNAIQNNFGVLFEIVPNVVASSLRSRSLQTVSGPGGLLGGR